MKIYLYLILGASFCLMSCEKENNIGESTRLSIGTSTDMLLNYYDTILIGGYHDLKSMDLDVNGDKIPDFRFTSEIWGSPGLGQHPKSMILCLNPNCMIYGIIKTDTTFLHKSTSVYTGSDNTIIIYNSSNYTCSRIDSNDSITRILTEQFKIIPIRKGEYLSKTDIFKSDTTTLINEGYSYPNFPTTYNDTVVYNNISFNFNCDSYPSDKICYIGIKIKDTKFEKLGWLKISISDNYKISILESAIQR